MLKSLNNTKIGIKGEICFIFSISVIFILLAYKLLFSFELMFAHDTIWYYGLIHYFYNSLKRGIFPYWDPYDYCGQPFYYNIGIARVLEFPSLILIFINRIVHGSLLTLYHWDFILRIIIIATGVYLCYRQTNRYWVSNILVFISFLFSSFSFGSMWQCGLLTTFMWTPYSVWFLLRLNKKINLYNIVGFAFFTGLSITSYQAGYVLTFLFFFLLTFLINDRAWFCKLFFKERKNFLYLLLGVAIVFALSLHTIAVYIEKDKTEPILRQMYSPHLSYYIHYKNGDKGVHCKPADFMGLIFPLIASSRGKVIDKHSFSEGPLYIGLLPFLLTVAGLILSQDKRKVNFILMVLITSFLMLGLNYHLGIWGEWLFPFLRYAQNMQLFQPFFIFLLMYFVGQGMDCIIDLSR